MTRTAHVCLAGLLLLPHVVLAKGTSTKIGIRIIYAVKAKVHSVDPALKDIKGELMELPFSKFRLLDRLEATVQMNSTVELQFPGNRTIAVTFKGIDTSMGKKMLSLHVAIKPAAKIALRIADGGRTMFIGPTHQDGKLIVDVSSKLKEKGK
jgi:hypothetical protein